MEVNDFVYAATGARVEQPSDRAVAEAVVSRPAAA